MSWRVYKEFLAQTEYFINTSYLDLATCHSSQMYVMNDKIYLRAETIESRLEVWVSDGSSSGTNMLKDIFPRFPPPSRMEPHFVALHGKAFFTTSDVTGTSRNYEVWVTDGTESGTQVLKDIYTDEKSTSTKNLAALSDRLQMVAQWSK